METMYSHATWFDALGVIEAWDDREEVAQTLARMSMWLYPPSFARVLASRRGSY